MKIDRCYSSIDEYTSLEQVTEALVGAGLESSNLIAGIGFTKSNECPVSLSFNRLSLHHTGDHLNPYKHASTHDQDVFSFYPEVRLRFRDIALEGKLAGPTLFAPVIEQALTIVEQSGGHNHAY